MLIAQTFSLQWFLRLLSLLFMLGFCAVVTRSGRYASRLTEGHDNLLILHVKCFYHPA